MKLEQDILAAAADSNCPKLRLRELFLALRQALEDGEVRAASPQSDATWKVNAFVKHGILFGFRSGDLSPLGASPDAKFYDKDTMAARLFHLEDAVRVVPGGSSVRRGAYVAPGVTMMPPAYVNIGAYVGSNSMIDSHALVGSCAQVGARVHISAGAQLGGVLEPIGALPVIIEDDVMVGGNTGIYEGVIVRRGAVVGTGTLLNGSTVVYDMVNQRELRPTAGVPLEIPEGAVVIPGARRLSGDFAERYGLSVQTPIIIKYRDARTDGRTSLEEALRQG